jgi:hypothetical protein
LNFRGNFFEKSQWLDSLGKSPVYYARKNVFDWFQKIEFFQENSQPEIVAAENSSDLKSTEKFSAEFFVEENSLETSSSSESDEEVENSNMDYLLKTPEISPKISKNISENSEEISIKPETKFNKEIHEMLQGKLCHEAKKYIVEKSLELSLLKIEVGVSILIQENFVVEKKFKILTKIGKKFFGRIFLENLQLKLSKKFPKIFLLCHMTNLSTLN